MATKAYRERFGDDGVGPKRRGATIGLAKGSSSPSPEGYLGAAQAEPALQTFASASGPSSSPPPWAEAFGSKKKTGADAKTEARDEKRADLALVRSPLPQAVKEHIVEKLAQFQSHRQVIASVSANYGISLHGLTLQNYDPQHRNCRLGKRLRLLYDETRKAWVEGVKEVAISHQAQRLRLIDRVVEKATSSKDYAAALKGLELAAKEMGGVLEGKSIVEHRGGVTHIHANIEDARREVAMRLAQVVDGGLLIPAPSSPTHTDDEDAVQGGHDT